MVIDGQKKRRLLCEHLKGWVT